jgi:hypothetical protein
MLTVNCDDDPTDEFSDAFIVNGGDFNVDLSRASTHTDLFKQFVQRPWFIK